MEQGMTMMEIIDFLTRRYSDALMHLTRYEKTGLRKVELDEVKQEIERLREEIVFAPKPVEMEIPGDIFIGDEEITGEDTEVNSDNSTTSTGRKRRKSSKRDDQSSASG